MPDPFPCASISRPNDHPGFKHLFHFLDGHLRVSFPEMNPTIALAGEYELHHRIL